MLTKIANWLEKKGRKRVILDRESKDPYLERYYLFLKDRENFPFNLFLHSFKKSDPTDLHDHPWGYATLVLKGGYWEWIPQYEIISGYTNDYGKYQPLEVPITTKNIIGERKKWRGPGHFRICRAESFHRIELDPNVKECWTLFIPFMRKREWGFLTHKKWKHQVWIQNENYIAKKRRTRKKKP